MAIEMVRPVESLSADLAEELLVVRIRVHEQVTLEVVLLRKPLAAHLTRDRDLL